MRRTAQSVNMTHAATRFVLDFLIKFLNQVKPACYLRFLCPHSVHINYHLAIGDHGSEYQEATIEVGPMPTLWPSIQVC